MKLITNKKSSGQTTLLIVLMIMAVSLGVGVAVSQRQATNLRKTTFTAQTDQAFSCANSGVERALNCIQTTEQAAGDPTTCTANQEALNVDDCTFDYTVSTLTPAAYSPGDSKIYLQKLPKDTVQQLDVSGVSSINLKYKIFDNNTGTELGLEVTEAYQNGAGDYLLEKNLYSCGGNPSDSNGFSASTYDSGTGICDQDVSLSGESPSIVRIRPYYSDAEVTITGDAAFASTEQGFIIRASGTAGNVTRNIEVLRMNPQLPSLFDYVLYSEEGSITK